MSIAEDIVDGLLCEECTTVVDGTAPGFPRKCTECEDDDE